MPEGVRFIVDPDDPNDPNGQSDEELDGGRSKRPNRLRIELGLGALVLLAGVVIARGASSKDSTPQAVSTLSPTISAAPTPTGPVTAPPVLYKGNLPPMSFTRTVPAVALPAHVPARRSADPRRCPRHCADTGSLPGLANEALQTAFPESIVQRVETVRLTGDGGVLWFREVDLRQGEDEINVQVEVPRSSDHPGRGTTTDHGQTTSFVRSRLGPYLVDVEVVDLLGGRPSTAALAELAHDSRITAL